MTRFDCNHLAHVIVTWQIQKFLLLHRDCFVLLYIWEQFPSTSPRGLMFRGTIYRRVFFLTSFGGLYLEGLIFGILRYTLLAINFAILARKYISRATHFESNEWHYFRNLIVFWFLHSGEYYPTSYVYNFLSSLL